MGGVQGIHEASLPYQRHARLSVLMVITLPTIGTHCSDRNNKKKMDGWMRRRGIKGKRRGVTIGWGFQVMLILLIYLISVWHWTLFTSDMPLLGQTDKREKQRESSENVQVSKENERHERRIAEGVPDMVLG